jgi:hypothetical protein
MPVEFKQFLCTVCNLDFKNPTDILDVVEHVFIKKIQETSAIY